MLAIQSQSDGVMNNDTVDRPRLPAGLAALPETFELATAGEPARGVREKLQELLANLHRTPGIEVREDPGRKGFFDIEHAGRTYFIYVYPSLTKVLLIATWAPDCFHRRR